MSVSYQSFSISLRDAALARRSACHVALLFCCSRCCPNAVRTGGGEKSTRGCRVRVAGYDGVVVGARPAGDRWLQNRLRGSNRCPGGSTPMRLRQQREEPGSFWVWFLRFSGTSACARAGPTNVAVMRQSACARAAFRQCPALALPPLCGRGAEGCILEWAKVLTKAMQAV